MNKEVIRGWLKEFIVHDKDKWSLVLFTDERRLFIGDDEAWADAWQAAGLTGQGPFNRCDHVEVTLYKGVVSKIVKVLLSIKRLGDVPIRSEGGDKPE